jgi:hypothetical protein
MKKKYLVVLSVAVFSAAAIVYSCKKDDEKTATTAQATEVVSTSLQANAIFDELYKSTEEVMTDLEADDYPSAGTKKSASLVTCTTVTVDKYGNKLTWPKTITISYNNCSGSSRLKKSGSIVITQSNKIRETGAVRTITLQNFTINDTILVEGKVSITNKTAVAGKPTIQVKLENGKITFNGGRYITRNFNRTITWKDGFSTLEELLNISDDVYAIYETASGSTKDGFSYNSVTTDSLEYKLMYDCIKKGKIEINTGGKKAYVDFTRQSCSDAIKVSIDGIVTDTKLNLFKIEG